MQIQLSFKMLVLLLGDILTFYLAFFAMLTARYKDLQPADIETHFFPFTISLLLWILIFYIGGFYEAKSTKNKLLFFQQFFGSLVSGGILMILLFYFIPAFAIAPKTNLFIFLIFFGAFLLLWRSIFDRLLLSQKVIERVLLIGGAKHALELKHYFDEHPELGFKFLDYIDRGTLFEDKELSIEGLINQYQATLVVVSQKSKMSRAIRSVIYEQILKGVRFMSLSDLYTRMLKKIPLQELEDIWSLKALPHANNRYSRFKYILEFFFAFLLVILLSPIFLLCILAIKLSSRGGAIYKQKRLGKNNRSFYLYKFRTMYSEKERNPDADSKAALWWAGKGDDRVTTVGKILRSTHLDELPQLFNVLKGEMSFVGPRPERLEFTKKLEKEIPFYDLRHLIKPGITGWAQISFGYGASEKDAEEKLQYELYYMENRSFLFDMIILLKTLKKFIL